MCCHCRWTSMYTWSHSSRTLLKRFAMCIRHTTRNPVCGPQIMGESPPKSWKIGMAVIAEYHWVQVSCLLNDIWQSGDKGKIQSLITRCEVLRSLWREGPVMKPPTGTRSGSPSLGVPSGIILILGRGVACRRPHLFPRCTITAGKVGFFVWFLVAQFWKVSDLLDTWFKMILPCILKTFVAHIPQHSIKFSTDVFKAFMESCHYAPLPCPW